MTPPNAPLKTHREQRVARLIGQLQAWPKTTLILWLVVTVLAVSGLTRLQFTSNHRAFFSEDNPELLALEQLEETFSQNDTVFFAVGLRDDLHGDLFAEKRLAAVVALNEASWDLPWAQRVSSVANFQAITASDDDLEVSALLPEQLPDNASDWAALKKSTLAEPRVQNLWLSADGRVAGISAKINIPEEGRGRAISGVHDAATKLADTIERNFPQVRVYIGGVVSLNAAFLQAMKKDTGKLYPIALLASLILLSLLLRNWLAALATTAITGLSVIITMGLVGWVSPVLNSVSASAVIMIMTLAVADCVHLQTTFRQRRLAGDPPRSAMNHALKLNFFPVAITSITTAIGFLSLNFSVAPPFQLLGNTVAAGVVIAWLLTLTLLPVIYRLPALNKVAGKRLSNNPIDLAKTPVGRMAAWVTARPRLMLLLLPLMLLIALSGLPRNEFGDDYVRYFSEDMRFRQDSDFINTKLTGQQLIEYGIEAGQYGSINNPEFLQQLDKFVAWLEQQPETRKVAAITALFKELNQAMMGGGEEQFVLPDSEEKAAQFLIFYELGLPPGKDLNDEIDIHKRATRVAVVLDTIDAGKLLAFEQRAFEWMQQHWPESLVTRGSGTSVMFSRISQRNFIAMLNGMAMVLVLVTIIMMITLRSVKLGVLSLIPNLLPAVAAFGAWGWISGRLDMATAVVGSMSLGIIIDDSVHLLSRYLHGKRKLGLNGSAAISNALASVGPALITTSSAIMLGFFAITFSQLALNASMAWLMMLIVSLALVTDLLLLPALLQLFDKEAKA